MLPSCCERSLAAGESPSVHARVCDRRPPEPPEDLEMDTLFDLPVQPEPEPAPVKHIVQWGGGVTSWATAHVIAQRHGIENLVLLFADTKAEHPDLYRFNEEASALVGVPITRVCDGRTPIEANRDRKFLGNSRLAPCSKILKQDPCRAWLEENSDPATDVLYVGIDAWEMHRIPGVRKGWAPWRVEFPLTEPPLRDKRGWIEEVRRLKVREPEMYRLGYPHNNCFGGCVRGGGGYWAHTLKTFPEVFAEHEQAESEFRTDGGDTATYLTMTRDGVERSLPLIELRHRIEAADDRSPALFDPYDIDSADAAAPLPYDPDDWGGCGCFTADEDEALADLPAPLVRDVTDAAAEGIDLNSASAASTSSAGLSRTSPEVS